MPRLWIEREYGIKAPCITRLSFKISLDGKSDSYVTEKVECNGVTGTHEYWDRDDNLLCIDTHVSIFEDLDTYKDAVEDLLRNRYIRDILEEWAEKNSADVENGIAYNASKLLYCGVCLAERKSMITMFPADTCNSAYDASVLATGLVRQLFRDGEVIGTGEGDTTIPVYKWIILGIGLVTQTWPCIAAIAGVTAVSKIAKTCKAASLEFYYKGAEALEGFNNVVQRGNIGKFIDQNGLQYHEIWYELNSIAANLGAQDIFELEDMISVLL